MKRTDADKRKNLPAIIILIAIAVVLAMAIVEEVVRSRIPTEEIVNPAEVYSAPAGKGSVISNGVLSELQAVWRSQHAYLPVDVIVNELNSRFYWDSSERVLVYTTPTEIISARADTLYMEDPVFVEQEDKVWVSLDYVAQYTNIQVDTFQNPNRVFIRSYWGSTTTATAGEEGLALRVDTGVKSKVLTHVPQGDTVTVLMQSNGWAQLYTDDGFTGYVPSEELEDVRTFEDKGPYTEPVYTRLSLDEPVCLVWHSGYQETGTSTIDAMLNQTQGVNVVSPSWFTIANNDGGIESYADEEYVTKVHNRGIQVWGLLENINSSTNIDFKALFSRTSTRTKLINGIMNLAQQYHLDGINVDIEGLSASAGAGYIEFIRELSVRCRNAGLILSVDNYVPSTWTAFYNRREQGVVADYVIIMGYDEHYKGSEAGSTASISFVRRGIEDTLKEVPIEKVINGIPFYTRLWETTNDTLSSKLMTMPECNEFLVKHNVKPEWNPDLAQNYAETVEEGVKYQIWLEDAASIREKLTAMKQYGLSGVACWKLGRETSDVWAVIHEYLND